MMQLQQRINAFVQLGMFLSQFAEETPLKNPSVLYNDVFFAEMQDVLQLAKIKNMWFTVDNLQYTCKNWGNALSVSNIENWLSVYKISEIPSEKRVAIVMAGNIPLVGFHDFMCVLLSGYSVLGKLSSNDTILLPFLTKYLMTVEPLFESKIELTTEKLEDFDAVIATGSDNTALYFKHYFGKYPNIIRKNRNSIAIITGKETPQQMEALADDIFRYFGLGCRNVSKIYVPKDYKWDHFFNGMFAWKDVINNHKYINNYDYNKAVYLMSLVKLLDNEFMILKEDTGFSSPISVVFYETYSNLNELTKTLNSVTEKIQCIISQKHIPFGDAQEPNLSDYADGVDTMEFLLSL
ncbi:acyl-CoA reductase [Rasiella sp. SM2506]|uniref:acyl-CoA reductase n=1 Tax=Rasiella sp. SM2506 TaxID=3423914 RepID=UPI003D7A80D4